MQLTSVIGGELVGHVRTVEIDFFVSYFNSFISIRTEFYGSKLLFYVIIIVTFISQSKHNPPDS